MATSRLSRQDLKDLEKYTKYLTFKSAMIIVQSRLGVKVHTQSKNLSSGTDWFNLSIRDNADVLSEIKKAYGDGSLLAGKVICTEISLQTAEGETMVLETWWLEISDRGDQVQTSRVSFTVYNRIGTLLKSLLCVTRATPAYKLSRRQGPDSYIICYRFYTGKPEFHLGEGYAKRTVGMVPTPVGTVCLSVAYRTKLLLSPTAHTRDLGGDLKDDHFRTVAPPHGEDEARQKRSEESEKSDDLAPAESPPRDDTIMQISPSSSPSVQQRHLHRNETAEANKTPAHDRVNTTPRAAFAQPAPIDRPQSDVADSSLPFGKLLECAYADEEEKPIALNDNAVSTGEQPMLLTSNNSGVSHGSVPEDFVMLELKTPPFAGTSEEEDLGKFYHECKVAPPLSMFDKSTDLQDMLNSITDQLAAFEANAPEFDDFVNSIQEVDF